MLSLSEINSITAFVSEGPKNGTLDQIPFPVNMFMQDIVAFNLKVSRAMS